MGTTTAPALPERVLATLKELGYSIDLMMHAGMDADGYTLFDGFGDRHRFRWDSPSDWGVISAALAAPDMVSHPPHYTSDPSGVECIQITRHRNFNVGNAIKYLWRNGLKEDPDKSARAKQIEDLRKTVFYVQDEIKRLEALPE
jgi:hypothetical protein